MDTSEYAGMFKWYQAFEEQTFSQPPGLRDAMRRWTLNLYPGIIKAAMAVFDVVESIAVSRTRICKAGGRSAKAATSLVARGFREVYSVSGGMIRWNAEERPIARTRTWT